MTHARIPDFSSPAPIQPARAVAVPLVIERLPLATPLGRFPGPPAPMMAPITIEAGPQPAPALVCLSRVMASAGEALACLVLVAGGCLFVGIATLL